jgi:hypothetical protein
MPTRIFQPPDSAPTSPSICVVVEAEAVQHLLGARLDLVAAEVLVLALHLAVALEDAVHVVGLVGVRHVALQLFELVVQFADLAAAGDRLVEHRAARHLAHVLAEVAEREALRHATRRPRRASPRRR